MLSALYYPFTKPDRKSFIKTSLFLWDNVDFIVPYHEFKPYGLSKEDEEALELIARSYVPTEADKKHVHEEFTKLCEGSLPDRFLFDLENPESAYEFYPQKLLPETWDLLADSRLAKVMKLDGRVYSASTNALFGYYMMSVLAVCCAHERKRLVTDNPDPYRALANIIVDENDSTKSKDDWHGRLVAISLNGPDFGNVSLKRLVELRKSEDLLFQEMRRTFTKSVDETAANIATHCDNPNIVSDLILGFSNDVEKKLADLKRALRRSATSTILSKECLVSVAAYTAALVTAPVIGGWSVLGSAVITAGGLQSALHSYKDRRRKLLAENPTSWLLAATGPKVPYV